MIAAVARRLAQDETLREAHPDLAGHLASGYLDERFGDGLARMKGEVDRAQLWRRVQDYMAGGRGPLYCSPEHADGRPIEWKELVEEGAVVSAGAPLLHVSPDPIHALNAVAGLALVGTDEDVAALTLVAGQRSGFPGDVRKAARTAIEAIRARE